MDSVRIDAHDDPTDAGDRHSFSRDCSSRIDHALSCSVDVFDVHGEHDALTVLLHWAYRAVDAVAFAGRLEPIGHVSPAIAAPSEDIGEEPDGLLRVVNLQFEVDGAVHSLRSPNRLKRTRRSRSEQGAGYITVT